MSTTPSPQPTRAGVVRDLPIFWKLLLPFLVLLLVVGAISTFIIVRDLTSKSQPALREELTVRAVAGRELLVMVAPICEGVSPCAPVGFAVVALDSGQVANAAASGAEGEQRRSITLFDTGGRTVASTSPTPPPPAELEEALTDIEQRRMALGGEDVATAYTGITLGGIRAGVVAVTVPATTAFSSVRDAALPLVGLLVVAMARWVGRWEARSGGRHARAVGRCSRSRCPSVTEAATARRGVLARAIGPRPSSSDRPRAQPKDATTAAGCGQVADGVRPVRWHTGSPSSEP